jgi:hypothetical protein
VNAGSGGQAAIGKGRLALDLSLLLGGLLIATASVIVLVRSRRTSTPK